MKTAIELPDDKVNVLLIKCSKCTHPVLVAVTHTMTNKDKNEAGRLVTDGCSSETIPLLEYRKLKFTGWCNSKCKPSTLNTETEPKK